MSTDGKKRIGEKKTITKEHIDLSKDNITSAHLVREARERVKRARDTSATNLDYCFYCNSRLHDNEGERGKGNLVCLRRECWKKPDGGRLLQSALCTKRLPSN
jgi:hypothetical protein